MADKNTKNCSVKSKEQQQAQITIKCLMHKARATKLTLAKYCAK